MSTTTSTLPPLAGSTFPRPEAGEPIERLHGDAATLRTPAATYRDEETPHIPTRPAAVDPDASAAELRDAALRRVEMSREALRAALLPPNRAAQRLAGGPAAADEGLDAVGGVGLMGTLRRMTRSLQQGQFGSVAGTAVGFLRGWWRAQPWHTTGEMVALAARTEIAPLARRHPWVALGGAALAGALLVKLKPWRWAPVAATVRPLAGVATRWSVAQLTSPTVQLVAAGVLSAWVRQRMQVHEAAEAQRLRERDPAV